MAVGVAACWLSVMSAARAETERLAQLWGGDRWLAGAGIDWSLVYTGEATAKVTGGGARSGANYRGDASLYMNLNTEAAKLWRGGTVVLHVQAQHGQTVSNRLGDFHCCSNITGGDFVQLAQLYYRHDFRGGHWLKIGKQEANDDFGGCDYSSMCTNSSAAFLPLMPLPSSPDQAWGVSAGVQATPHLSVSAGAFRDKFGHQPIYFAQPNLRYSVNGLPGDLYAGWWWDTNPYPSVNTVTPRTYGGSYGYYVSFDQKVACQGGQGDDCRGVGLFGHFAWAPRNRSTAHTGWALGLQWTGPLPSRPKDAFALAVFQVGFDPRAGLAYSTETAIEALYSAQVRPWLAAKAGAQYLIHPGGGGADALVLGTRFETTF
ncbi:MAG: carbohydrate porin [Armatimonadetes bacterium]|nr:carbohydrate porin [Armatimonadota bacterium]